MGIRQAAERPGSMAPKHPGLGSFSINFRCEEAFPPSDPGNMEPQKGIRF